MPTLEQMRARLRDPDFCKPPKRVTSLTLTERIHYKLKGNKFTTLTPCVYIKSQPPNVGSFSCEQCKHNKEIDPDNMWVDCSYLADNLLVK